MNIKLGDFGLAKVKNESFDPSNLRLSKRNSTSFLVGTPMYMSPE
jgi:serine/threonine protein kinase